MLKMRSTPYELPSDGTNFPKAIVFKIIVAVILLVALFQSISFYVESLWFANGPVELDIRANANDWNNDGKLDTTETWVFTKAGTVGESAYTNTGTASGNYTDGGGHSTSVSDDDGSGYTVATQGLTFAPAVTLPTATSDPLSVAPAARRGLREVPSSVVARARRDPEGRLDWSPTSLATSWSFSASLLG